MSLDAIVTWRDLLVIIVLVLLVYVAEMVYVFRARLQKPPEFSLDSARETAMLREEVRLLQDEMNRMKKSQAEPVIVSAPAAPAAMVAPLASPASVESPYARAIQLAKQGIGVHEVATQCGISRGEAELIVAMHRSDMD